MLRCYMNKTRMSVSTMKWSWKMKKKISMTTMITMIETILRCDHGSVKFDGLFVLGVLMIRSLDLILVLDE